MLLFLGADETMHGEKMVSRHGTIVWSAPSRSLASSSMERPKSSYIRATRSAS